MTCCTPRRSAPDPYRGVRLYHTCAAKLDLPYREVTVPVTSPALVEPVHADCTWHERLGIPYLTSGSCQGPACLSYAEAHADDEVSA